MLLFLPLCFCLFGFLSFICLPILKFCRAALALELQLRQLWATGVGHHSEGGREAVLGKWLLCGAGAPPEKPERFCWLWLFAVSSTLGSSFNPIASLSSWVNWASLFFSPLKLMRINEAESGAHSVFLRRVHFREAEGQSI